MYSLSRFDPVRRFWTCKTIQWVSLDQLTKSSCWVVVSSIFQDNLLPLPDCQTAGLPPFHSEHGDSSLGGCTAVPYYYSLLNRVVLSTVADLQCCITDLRYLWMKQHPIELHWSFLSEFWFSWLLGWLAVWLVGWLSIAPFPKKRLQPPVLYISLSSVLCTKLLCTNYQPNNINLSSSSAFFILTFDAKRHFNLSPSRQDGFPRYWTDGV